MWSKQQTLAERPAVSPSQGSAAPVVPFNSASNSQLGGTSARSSARLGASIKIKGQLTGAEALQIDGKVDGPISHLNSEIHAGELVVSGKVVGNVHVRGRVDIKREGSIIGDIFSARISIEDGAHFKGRIEIDPTKSRAAAD